MKITLTLTIELPDGSPLPQIDVKQDTNKAAPPPATPSENVRPSVSRQPQVLDAEKSYTDVAGIARKYKKSCQQCKRDFATDIAIRKFCSNKCKKDYTKAYARDWYSKNKESTSEVAQPTTGDSWGSKVTDGRTHSRPSNQKTRAWNSEPTLAQEPKEYAKPAVISAENQAEVDRINANFQDPWDCNKCRNCGCLCPLHESMALEGKKPPSGNIVGGGSGSGNRYIPGHKIA